MSQSQPDKDREAELAAKYAAKTMTPAERAEFANLVSKAV